MTLSQESTASGPVVKPVLWNPNAAANWSIPFTPVFGSILNYLNWKALDDSVRSRKSLVWVWVNIVLLVLVLTLSKIGRAHV